MGNPLNLSSAAGTSASAAAVVTVGSTSGVVPSNKGKEVHHAMPGTQPPAPQQPFEMPEWANSLFDSGEVLKKVGGDEKAEEAWAKNFRARVENAMVGTLGDIQAQKLAREQELKEMRAARKGMQAAMGMYSASLAHKDNFPALFVATQKYRCLLNRTKFRLSDGPTTYVPGPGEEERLLEAVKRAIAEYRGNSTESLRYGLENFEKYCKALTEYEAKIQPVRKMPPNDNPMHLITLPEMPQVIDGGAIPAAAVNAEVGVIQPPGYEETPLQAPPPGFDQPRLLLPAPPPDYTAPPTRALSTLLKHIEKPTFINRFRSLSTEPAKLEIKRLREYLAGLSPADTSERDHAFRGLARAFTHLGGFDQMRVLHLIEGFFDPEHVNMNTNPKAARAMPLGLRAKQVFSEFARAEILVELLGHAMNQRLPVAETLVGIALNNYEDLDKIHSSLSSAILLGALLSTLGRRSPDNRRRAWIGDELANRIITVALRDIPPLYQGHATDMDLARPEVLQCFEILKDGLDATGDLDNAELSVMLEDIYRAAYLGTPGG
jgi:hypothetical protein